MDYEINDLGSLGLMLDDPPHQLPPEAFTLMENVRLLDLQKIARLPGWEQVFGTPGAAPHFLMSLIDPVQSWWLYTSLTKAFVWDGSNHVEITNSGGDYSTSESTDWDGTILGGIPIINNGNDPPQAWLDYNTAAPLVDLPNWPANTTAKAIKAFSPYLVAVNVSKSGTRYPHMVKWSHGAEVGSVPSSWDETDPTVDAGENELHDTTAGMLLNALTLRGQMYLYKQGSVWRLQQTGGRGVFRFDTFIESNGLIGQKSFCLSPDGLAHVCMMQDDLVIHDGQTVKSLGTRRIKRELFNRLDPGKADRSFLFANPQFSEIWICYPERNMDYPNRAMIWNAVNNAFTEASIDFRCAAIGPVETSDDEQWDNVLIPWDEYTLQWSNVTRRATLVGNPTTVKLLQLDKGLTRDGADFLSRVQRTALALVGKSRNGAPIVDYKQIKMYRKIWIKATGSPFQVKFGVQDFVDKDSPILWDAPQDFDPKSQRWADFLQSGAAIAIEFSSTAAGQWEIQGYKPEIVPVGNFP